MHSFSLHTVIGKLAHEHVADQAGPGDSSGDGRGGDRRAGDTIETSGARVLGDDVNLHLELRWVVLELAGDVFADALFRAATAGAGLLVVGKGVFDARVREMVERGPPPRARCFGLLGRLRCVGLDRRGGVKRKSGVVELDQMPLAGFIDDPFAARAEDVSAKEGERLHQFGVLLLELMVVCRGLCEYAFQLTDAALRVFHLPLRAFRLLLSGFGLPLSGFGLLPQVVVAA
jgi:hypothetical protein